MKPFRLRRPWWACLIEWDKALTERLHLPPGHPWRWVAVVGAHLGDGPLWLAFWLGALFYWRSDLWLSRGIALWLISALAAAVVTYSIKFTVRRARPRHLSGFYSQRYDAHAFPSGHATRMGTVALWGPLLFPAWAGLFWPVSLGCALSRAALGVHYVGDVLVGLLIGIGVSAVVLGVAVHAGFWLP